MSCSKGPERLIDYLRPPCLSMKGHSESPCRNITNALLNNTINVMWTSSSHSVTLTMLSQVFCEVFCEVFVGEYTIVGTIFLNSVLVALANLFIKLFTSESFVSICRFLEMGKNKASGNINKECACGVTAREPMSMHHVWEARTTSNHLNNTAHFTWVKWVFINWLRIAKRTMLGFAILAFAA